MTSRPSAPLKKKDVVLADRIHELTCVHGSLRALAKVLEVDAGYLSRLYHGKKTRPGATLLRRLGLRQIISITYRLAKRKPK